MTRDTVDAISSAGADKLMFSRSSPWRFLFRSAIAGFFIVIGTLFSNLCGALLLGESVGAAKLLAALSFSSALTLIVFLGGELFTGSTFVTSISLFERRISFAGLLRIWGLCYLGNFLGILLLCALISLSVDVSRISEYLMLCLPGKLNSPWYTLLLKGIVCNFLVCIGVFAGFKLKSEFGKALAILSVIMCFVTAGLEHSIANMATFCLAAMFGLSADYGAMALNLLFVTVGNILGGVLLWGLPVWLSAEKSVAAAK